MTPLHLVSSVDGDIRYDWDRMEPILRDLGKITKWEAGHDLGFSATSYDFWCTYEDEDINVAVDDTMRVLTLYSTSDTALAYALTLQRKYGDEIYLFAGDNISAAIPLGQVSDVRELRRRLQQPADRPIS